MGVPSLGFSTVKKASRVQFLPLCGGRCTACSNVNSLFDRKHLGSHGQRVSSRRNGVSGPSCQCTHSFRTQSAGSVQPGNRMGRRGGTLGFPAISGQSIPREGRDRRCSQRAGLGLSLHGEQSSGRRSNTGYRLTPSSRRCGGSCKIDPGESHGAVEREFGEHRKGRSCMPFN